jgi:predicted small lipoprotein YifL
MLRASQILVRTFALALCAASLGACGQRGPLYLPTAPEAAQRATLPETLRAPLRTPLRTPLFDDAPEPAAAQPANGR